MNQFNKEILDALSSDSKTSLKDVFRNQLEQTVNTLLQEELSAVLGYQPYERNDSCSHGDNARNGSYQRTIDTEFGTINITLKVEFIPKHLPVLQVATARLHLIYSCWKAVGFY